jgi:hypothetical protein
MIFGLTACTSPLSTISDVSSSDLAARTLGIMNGGSLTSGVSFDLLAGQTILAGSVGVGIDGEDLLVTYSTVNGWKLSEVQLSVGIGTASIPTNKAGNPVIGSFPYKATGLGGAVTYAFRIPLSTYNVVAGTTLTFAAHAVVTDGTSGSTETAWGAGSRITAKGNWATFFTVTFGEQAVVESEESTETAFAYGASYAIDFRTFDGANRWGWTNGPLPVGTYAFDIYAGAGQSDTSKGTLVGKLSVVYSGGTARVTYTMKAGYVLTETHLYAGSAPLPTNKRGELTVAPGQYPQIHGSLSGVSSDSYDVAGLSGDVYVIAHAVVKGRF